LKVSRASAGGLAALVSAVVLCAAPLLAASSRHRVSDAPTPEWREGPIRYIITKSEDKEYSQLDDQEARQRFIESFWLRRDPTPGTPGNEFRATFWRRVRRANSLHGKDTPKPGWLTDMGKIYILFGPPDEISRDEMAEGRRGIIVWMYRNTPGVGPNKVMAGANQVIAFAQDGSNEYRLTAEPTKMADVWEGLPDPQPPSGVLARFKAQQEAFQEAYGEYIGLTDPVIRAHGGPPHGGALGLTMLLGRLQQPPKEWELTSEVRTQEFFGALPFQARADFFRLGDGRAEVLITLAVRSSVVTYRTPSRGEEPAVQAYGTIFDSTGTIRIASIEQAGGFTPARENLSAGLDDNLLFQARVILKPGAYRAQLTVLDEVSERSSSSGTPFTVPDFGRPGLEMSSISLARSIESAEGRDRAFRLGKLRVLPRMGNAFAAGDELAFYYQIYGADRAQETGEPRLDVSYIFMAAQGEEIQEIGRILFEDQTAEAHGYVVPLEGWPAGSYLVRIEVADAIGVQEASREIAFRILEAPGTAPQP
jgi:GWxTD domain-containing protein